jgi:hypothetical protein
MDEITELKKEIQELKAWKRSLESSHSIPVEIDQAFRDRLGGSSELEVTGTGSPASTSSYSSFNVVVPANPSGTLKVLVDGTLYELLYK